MYLYYLLAACGPKIQKYLWWKRWENILSPPCHYHSFTLCLYLCPQVSDQTPDGPVHHGLCPRTPANVLWLRLSKNHANSKLFCGRNSKWTALKIFPLFVGHRRQCHHILHPLCQLLLLCLCQQEESYREEDSIGVEIILVLVTIKWKSCIYAKYFPRIFYFK